MKTKGLTIIVAVALSACTFNPDPLQETVTISAQNADEVLSRTTVIAGGTQVYWEAAEEINVFYDGVGAKFVSKNSEPALSAEFTGNHSGLANYSGGPIWGLYPYDSDASADDQSINTYLPSTQTGRADSFAKDTHLSVACGTSLNLSFRCVTGGVRFSLTQDGIKSVTFEGTNKEFLAGYLRIAFVDGKPVVQSVKGGATSLELVPPGGGAFETGKWYYIEAVPVTLSGGFKMVFHKENEYASISTGSSVTIERGKYGSIAAADEGLSFVPEGGGQQGAQQAVDLGLAVKWASCNVGADNPEDCGDYFAWGEIEPYYQPGYSQSASPVWKTGKDAGYDWPSYKWCNGSYSTLTKYNNSYSYGSVDYKSKLLEEDDAAAQAGWQGTWRMPTEDDWYELLNNCTWMWTTLNGIKGYRVTGTNSNSIFLPAAGYWGSTTFSEKGSTGFYWGANRNSGLPFYGFYLEIRSGAKDPNASSRSFGFSVRPVQD